MATSDGHENRVRDTPVPVAFPLSASSAQRSPPSPAWRLVGLSIAKDAYGSIGWCCLCKWRAGRSRCEMVRSRSHSGAFRALFRVSESPAVRCSLSCSGRNGTITDSESAICRRARQLQQTQIGRQQKSVSPPTKAASRHRSTRHHAKAHPPPFPPADGVRSRSPLPHPLHPTIEVVAA